MELKISIGYEELLDLIKQLPPKQMRRLQQDIQPKPLKKNLTSFRTLLLQGPVMED